MTNKMISISPSSASLTYVVIFHLHLHMVYIYRSFFVMQVLAQHFLVQGNLLTDKLMSQGFQLLRSQETFRKFYGGYNDLICP
jgi:hypothetical protein